MGSADLGARLKQVFDNAFKDKSNTISRSDMQEVLKSLDPSFTQQELDVLFDGADKDGNGVIDYNEFIDFVCYLDDEIATTTIAITSTTTTTPTTTTTTIA